MASGRNGRTEIAIADTRSPSAVPTKISNLESYTKKLNIMAGPKSPDVLTAPAGSGANPET
jgi:hypothetical protein